MAKKKTAKKRRRRTSVGKVVRRRRRSSVGGVDFVSIVAAVAGAVGGKLIDKIIPATIDPRIVAGIKIAVGVGLPMLFKGKQKNFASSLGTGLAVVGTLDLLNTMGVISGMPDEVIEVDMSGVEDIPILNGNETDDDIPIVNGSSDETDFIEDDPTDVDFEEVLEAEEEEVL